MKSFKAILEESAVKVEFDRYENSTGKKPKKTPGTWMFTDAKRGKGDVFSAKFGSYAECVKQAKAWAKSKGYDVIYVME